MLWKRRLPGVRFWNRLRFRREYPALEREVFGIRFRHPIGLAPVLERQVELLDVCDSIGYSFTGVIPGDMPAQAFAECLQARKSTIVTAVELRADGPSETEAMQQLVRQFSLLYDFTDFFVILITKNCDYMNYFSCIIPFKLYRKLYSGKNFNNR